MAKWGEIMKPVKIRYLEDGRFEVIEVPLIVKKVLEKAYYDNTYELLSKGALEDEVRLIQITLDEIKKRVQGLLREIKEITEEKLKELKKENKHKIAYEICFYYALIVGTIKKWFVGVIE